MASRDHAEAGTETTRMMITIKTSRQIACALFCLVLICFSIHYFGINVRFGCGVPVISKQGGIVLLRIGARGVLLAWFLHASYSVSIIMDRFSISTKSG